MDRRIVSRHTQGAQLSRKEVLALRIGGPDCCVHHAVSRISSVPCYWVRSI